MARGYAALTKGLTRKTEAFDVSDPCWLIGCFNGLCYPTLSLAINKIFGCLVASSKGAYSQREVVRENIK